ncbi:DsbA family protein [Aestuariibius sp. HNIBRBA575]|uniref:DsbA family protein n=1 Tax=Aestuariibius sp. HNIBRBA575 TaxID=3233343 RepID=UPI0034A351C2
MNRLAAAALSFGLVIGAGFPASATDLDALSDAERDAFRAEVRAYLLDNPEVLMEAIDVLESRQADAQANVDVNLARANADALFDDGFSWEGGNPDGDITIVEFLDYRCGYCKRAHPEVAELVSSDGNIRVIVKEFPILGEQSMLASQFALAAQIVEGNEGYKLASDALMTMRGEISGDSLTRLAEALGFDSEAILDEMTSDEVGKIIEENRLLAQRLQISGTPTFVFQDQMLRGYVPLDGMRNVVRDLRAEG